MGGVSGAVRRGVSPRAFMDTVSTGLQLAGGWVSMGVIGALEQRLGLASVLGAIPGGAPRTLFGYVVKGVNVALVGVLSSVVLPGKSFAGLRTSLTRGAMANFGVTLARDVAGMLGGPGDRIRAYLSGMGDFFAADGWPAMGDYLNAGGQPALAENFRDDNVVAGAEGVYTSGTEIYPSAANRLY